MVRELIFMDLRLGPDTDRWKEAFAEVQDAMRRIGVEPGRMWHPMTGSGRTVVIEREFESLAAYEADDERFHDATDFMALWRTMEALLDRMRVEVWQS